MLELDRRRPAAALLADQADRPQLQPPQLADQRRIGALEPGLKAPATLRWTPTDRA
jgi:hypothetical protein